MSDFRIEQTKQPPPFNRDTDAQKEKSKFDSIKESIGAENGTVSAEKLSQASFKAMQKPPLRFEDLPVMSNDESIGIASKLKLGEFFLRKSSDNKSLVVVRNEMTGVVLDKYAPSAVTSKFIVNKNELSLSEIIEMYGGESKEIRLQSAGPGPVGPSLTLPATEPQPQQSYRFPKIPRQDAERMLAGKEFGTFLLRPKNDDPSHLIITYVNNQKQIIHYDAAPAEGGKYQFNNKILSEQEIIEEMNGTEKLIMPSYRFRLMTRQEAENLLAGKPLGTFLLRPQNSDPKHLAISYVHPKNGTVAHTNAASVGGGKYAFEGEVLSEHEIIDRVGGRGKLMVPTAAQKEIQKSQEEPAIQKSQEELLAGVRAKIIRAAARYKILHEGEEMGAKPMVPQYWAELIHEEHGYGRQINDFFQAWKNSTSTQAFNDWMQRLENGENVPGKELINPAYLHQGKPAISRVIYLNAEQRKAYEMIVDNEGKVATVSEGKLNTKESPHIFVVTPEGKTYIGLYDRGTFNHSSFTGGRPVLSGGELIIADGKIVGITDKSGHYETDPKMIVAGIQALMESGVNLDGTKLFLNAHPLAGKPMEERDALTYFYNYYNL